MAKVTYEPSKDQVAEGGLPDETTQFGYDFKIGKAVDVTNAAHLRKFSGHPFFKVTGSIPKEATVRTAAERDSASLGSGSNELVTAPEAMTPIVQPVSDQPEPGPAKVTPGQADAPEGDSDLRAVQRGRGVYAVMRGDKDEELLGGLTKVDAEAFNQLSAEDKASYVETAPSE